MEENSTRFITSTELKDCSPDIYSDAFGLDALTDQLLSQMKSHTITPDDSVIIELFKKIKKSTKVH